MKKDLKKSLLLLTVLIGLTLSAGNVFAGEISSSAKTSDNFKTEFMKLVLDTDSNQTDKIESIVNSNSTKKKNKKIKLWARKDKSEKKQKVESEIPDINKNIVSPNESPGIITDPQRTKRYYDSFEGAHRTHIKKDKTAQPVIEEETLQLPARIQKDGKTIHIKKIEFTKSEIFTDKELSKFKALAEGQDFTAEDLNNFIAIINNQYRKKNIITARAYLNAGAYSAGVLKIELMEAKIGDIIVQGNKFNRAWYLRTQLSSKSGDVLNLQTMEKDLRKFNKNARSIQLSAKLKPGKEYGTTDIILQADEKFPYHFSASWDSFGRETTGLLRGGFMASTDSFLGFQDRLTGAINLSRGAQNPFVDYNFPINKRGTRVGVSYMYGNNKVKNGQYRDFDLGANTHVLSAYITHPLIESEKGSLSFNTSANLKFSKATISDFTYSNYRDYNFAVGFGGHRNFKRSVFYGSIYSTHGIIEDRIRNHSKYFTKLNADGYYVHYLPHGIIGTLRAGGQYSPHDIAYIEQYQIGGISSVRGYSESLLLASNAYFVSAEMLFPIPFLPENINIPFTKGTKQYRLRDSFKFALFCDHGAIFPYRGYVGTPNFLMSVGFGFRMAISKYITARLYLGIPVMNTRMYQEPNARVHFDLIVSPF